MQSTDTYSMGVLLWELYACRRAWSGLLPPQVIIKVGIQKARLPPLPGAPAEYQVRARWAWPRLELFLPTACQRPVLRELVFRSCSSLR